MGAEIGSLALQLHGFLQHFMRVTGFLFMAPIFSQSSVPVSIRIPIGVSFALLFCATTTPSPPPAAALVFLFGLIRELILGLVIGGLIAIPFSILQSAGGLGDALSGFSTSAVFNPATGISSTAISNVLSLLGTFVFLSLDGHHWLLAALANSFLILPVGGEYNAMILFEPVVLAMRLLMSIAWRIISPLILCMVLLEVVLIFSSRIAPKINILLLSLPARIMIALIVILATLEISLGTWMSHLKHVFSNLPALMTRMSL